MNILEDKGKRRRRYNPDLARKVNKEYERAMARGEEPRLKKR